MPTLRREDGAQFVTQSYRDVLHAKKSVALKKELRDLAQNYGDYVRIFHRDPGNILEVVLSREPGYLLGEEIWHYFGKPANLIYCEALPERQQALLVIVKNSVIYLDTKISYANLIDELAALTMSDERFVIHVYGDVPVSDTKKPEVFAFNPERVESFSHLTGSVFSKLELNSLLQLQPLELALTGSEFSRPLVVPLSIAAGIFLAIIIAWNLYQAPPKMPQTFIEDPYETYYQALRTPSPPLLIKELIYNVSVLYSLPGWEVSDINYTDGNFRINLKPTIGKASQLEEWAVLNNYKIQITATSATLQIASKLQNRPTQKYIYNLSKLLNLLVDRVDDILPRENIHVGNITKSRSSRYVSVTVNFSDQSPATLIMVGSALQWFPIQLTSVNISVHNNLFSGNMVLLLWGDGQ